MKIGAEEQLLVSESRLDKHVRNLWLLRFDVSAW